MPSYVKFMKKILANKKKLGEFEIVALTEEFHPKLKDLGSFSIPCSLGNTSFWKEQCDIGVSINLMPISVFRKL